MISMKVLVGLMSSWWVCREGREGGVGWREERVGDGGDPLTRVEQPLLAKAAAAIVVVVVVVVVTGDRERRGGGTGEGGLERRASYTGSM